MMVHRTNKLILKSVLVIALIVAASLHAHAGNVEAGDSAYTKKAYAEALMYYKTALEKDGTSSDLYYNIGNTYYRLGDLGHSVISYKRALALDPSNADAQYNLNYVKTKIADKPEDDSTFLSNVHDKVISLMHPDAWAWTAFGIFVVLVGALALYMFGSNINLRKAGFFGGIILLCVFIYALIVALSASRGLDDHDIAVVISPTTNLRSNPSSSSNKTDKVVPIHEGTELVIIDSVATPDDPATMMWYEVKLNNTTRAFVSSSDVERV